MTELPTGTVTFVFTDIKGSTRLLASLGSRYETVHLGDSVEATKLLAEALAAGSELGSKEIVAGCLDGLASIAVRNGKADQAARFLGAAERCREEVGMTAERFERELHEETMSLVSGELGDEELSKVMHEGWSARPEAAIREAMQ